MVIRISPQRRAERGALSVELLVAILLLVSAVLPLAYSFKAEQRFARASYQRAVAMEIVDGEFEALLAGEWRAFGDGTRDYPVHCAAATNLPPGRFLLTLEGKKVHLEWRPSVHDHGGTVIREGVAR